MLVHYLFLIQVVTAQAITTPVPEQTTDAPDLTTKLQVTEEIVTAEHPKYSTELPPEGKELLDFQ